MSLLDGRFQLLSSNESRRILPRSMLEEKLQQRLLIASTESLGTYMCCKFLLLICYNDINYCEIFVLFHRPKLKEEMQYCVDHPEEISKLAKVKAQVSEVKGVMMENIEKVKQLSSYPFYLWMSWKCFLRLKFPISVYFLGRHIWRGLNLNLHNLVSFWLICCCDIYILFGRFLTVGRKLSFWWIKQRTFALRSIVCHYCIFLMIL